MAAFNVEEPKMKDIIIGMFTDSLVVGSIVCGVIASAIWQFPTELGIGIPLLWWIILAIDAWASQE